MADGKWISGLTPELPMIEAARLTLPARLQVVLRHLPLALREPARDPEHVHQLRVAARRAAAALRVFRECLPASIGRDLRNHLRSIRRAAGAARDWDVFRITLDQAPGLRSASATAARDFLHGIQTARRMDAQTQLVEAQESGDKLERDIAQLNEKSMEWRDFPELAGTFAHARIQSLMDDFDEAATPPPAEYEQLHRLRIIGKRLRYSVEIFVDCFAEPVREQVYPAIAEMQEILGRITDAHVAASRLIEIRDHVKAFQPGAWSRYRKPIELMLQTQRRVLPRERKRFVAWLAGWRQMRRHLVLEPL